MEIGPGPSRLARAALGELPPVQEDADFAVAPQHGPQIERSAAKTIASVPYCWLATSTAAGLPSMRPMGRLPRGPGDDDWTIRFVTDGRSRKAADIRRAPEVALRFQRDADDAYVALTGAARLLTRESKAPALEGRLRPVLPHLDRPRANAAFLEVEARRLELWIRGVTPEPFGLQARPRGGARLAILPT